jgi:hypothetical protein
LPRPSKDLQTFDRAVPCRKSPHQGNDDDQTAHDLRPSQPTLGRVPIDPECLPHIRYPDRNPLLKGVNPSIAPHWLARPSSTQCSVLLVGGRGGVEAQIHGRFGEGPRVTYHECWHEVRVVRRDLESGGQLNTHDAASEQG